MLGLKLWQVIYQLHVCLVIDINFGLLVLFVYFLFVFPTPTHVVGDKKTKNGKYSLQTKYIVELKTPIHFIS